MDEPLDREMESHQASGLAWNPFRQDIERLLGEAEHAQVQPIYYGSNHCFLVTLDAGLAGRSLAVYKPARGEYPLYDFPNGSLYRRELGSWLVSKILGWNLVPPTVAVHGKYGKGSLQLFIEGHDQGELELEELRRLALLDVVLNNADRKADHLLIGDGDKLWGIDHGLTFHTQIKLRTVLWHFVGSRVPKDDLEDLRRLCDQLSAGTSDATRLRELISTGEWTAFRDRVSRVVDSGCFPDPRYKPIPYRW